MTQPLFSCLMVTQSGRFELFRDSVRDFLAQTSSPRELIIVTASPEEEVTQYRSLVQNLRLQPDVSITFPPSLTMGPGRPTLGWLRNYTNALAQGEFCCTWDDDDRHHPNRLQAHYEAIMRDQADISHLNQQLHFFVQEKQLYWIDWGSGRCPGIVMYRRMPAASYPVSGLTADRGEDNYFMQRLLDAGMKSTLVDSGRPILYLRQFHGQNTWDRAHHLNLASRKAIGPAKLRERQPELMAAINLFKLPRPLDINAQGHPRFLHLQ